MPALEPYDIPPCTKGLSYQAESACSIEKLVDCCAQLQPVGTRMLGD